MRPSPSWRRARGRIAGGSAAATQTVQPVPQIDPQALSAELRQLQDNIVNLAARADAAGLEDMAARLALLAGAGAEGTGALPRAAAAVTAAGASSAGLVKLQAAVAQRLTEALLLTTLTTIIGFRSFIPSAMRGIQSTGIVVCIGMALAFLASITLHPAR